MGGVADQEGKAVLALVMAALMDAGEDVCIVAMGLLVEGLMVWKVPALDVDGWSLPLWKVWRSCSVREAVEPIVAAAAAVVVLGVVVMEEVVVVVDMRRAPR